MLLPTGLQSWSPSFFMNMLATFLTICERHN
ncbi:hypothetical protein NSPZN2_10388 [Nitrospira defluvii]|uniref:Transposase n=1 Tax=Nitrospira defluvii TaxID=330214 RepID=A0ABM8QFK2_9BACT|nr:hypothetical protein NSPZN2_10388 [Nitrospira defluvii]